MDFDIPTDLINKSQIGFRDLARLQSYDPKPNLQSPPLISTLEASISTLDPSPECLRCNYCQGKLLRGLQSLICAYCGEYQKNDNDHDSICFNSTHGYSWLLQSLNFNGSERVGSLAEGSGLNGGQSPAEDEATLSELLDLKILWPKKRDNIKICKRNSSVNFGTADVDNFFIESKRAIVSDFVPEEIDQNKSIDDDSSGWNAEFQSADTEIVNEISKPVDLSSHMDSVFGQMESFDSAKPNDDLNLFHSEDPLANMSFELLDSAVQTNDGLSGHLNDLNSKSMDAVFGQMESFNVRKPNNDLDLFSLDDPFANMSSENFQQVKPLESVVQANDLLSGNKTDLNSNSVDQDWFNDNNWQKSGANLNNPSSTEAASIDQFGNNWQKSRATNTTTVKDNKPLFESGLDNLNKHHSDDTLEATDWFQNSQWSIGASSTTNIATSKDDDDDEWNDFTSSTGHQDSFLDSRKDSSNKKIAVNEKTSKLDFGNFVHSSDIFSGLSSNKNPNDTQAVYDIFSEISTASKNANSEAGNSPNGLKNDEIISYTTTGSKDNIQMLMSQMHDLSFMLKNELSIPSKPDNRDP